MKKIFLLALRSLWRSRISVVGFLIFSQTFGDCKNCNKITMLTTPSSLGFQKKPKNQKPKATSQTLHKATQNEAKSNNQKPVEPNLVPTHIQNATATTNVFGSTDNALLVTTTSSGNILVIGTTNTNSGFPNTSSKSFAIASYSSTGAPNTSFGTKGVATTNFAATLTGGSIIGSTDIPLGFAILSNGNIIVVGNSNANALTSAVSSASVFALAQYSATDGSLVRSFGTNGLVLTNISSSSSGTTNDTLVTAAIQTSGNRLVVAGNTNFFSDSSFAVVRYNATNGAPDNSFGSGGVFTFNIASTLNPSGNQLSTDILTSMTILSNNKIILCGYSNYLYPNFQFVVVRLSANGSLDTSFNKSGIVLTSVSQTIGTTSATT